MGTIFIRASEDIGLGSRHLVWVFVDPDGRTTVFARGQHLKFSLEPPPMSDESPLVLIARVALEAARIEAYLPRGQDHGTRATIEEPVIVRRRGVMRGYPVFRGTLVPPGPIFSMLADLWASEIIRNDCPSVSKADIELALQQACSLLEREAPWVD